MVTEQPQESVRLNRWFTEQGVCSRREADRWIAQGRVTINGEPATLGAQVGPRDRVAVDGQEVRKTHRPPVVIAYNKPIGVECTSDPKKPDNIIAAVGYPERVVHIGRLDQMSEGLILLTNRGDIVNLILRSEYEHDKEYHVDLSAPVTDAQIEQLARGLDIGDELGRTRPCVVERLGPARLKMVLTEGRNRQIRRMAEAIGHHVKRLERVRIMHIKLGGLARGRWRHLSEPELRELWRRLGLKGDEKPRTKRPMHVGKGPKGPAKRPRPKAPAPALTRGPRR
ncbi:MAG: pseudouridine synthase [Deltaproteobacteria bacterium]|nr:pseudouridine synthase [Deltaproteobacteria bacterium]